MEAFKETIQVEMHRKQRHAHVAFKRSQKEETQKVIETFKQDHREVMDKKMVSHFLDSFCRKWQRGKPDLLYDFVVYREKADDPGLSTRLLIGFPGPNNTPWEGGLYPAILKWIDMAKPPTCSFPGKFRHHKIASFWSKDLDLLDVLFIIQQSFAHDKDNIYENVSPHENITFCHEHPFEETALAHAQVYSKAMFEDNTTRYLVIDMATWQSQKELYLAWCPRCPKPSVPANPPALKKRIVDGDLVSCCCSCCAWTAPYSGRDMRLLICKLQNERF